MKVNKYLEKLASIISPQIEAKAVRAWGRMKQDGFKDTALSMIGKGKRDVRSDKASRLANIMESQARSAAKIHKLNREVFKGYPNVLKASGSKADYLRKAAIPYTRRSSRATEVANKASGNARILAGVTAGTVGIGYAGYRTAKKKD